MWEDILRSTSQVAINFVAHSLQRMDLIATRDHLTFQAKYITSARGIIL